MKITELTAVTLGKKIKAKEITVAEAVSAVLEQIEAVEGDVHAYVTLKDKEKVLKKAEEIQAKIDAGELDGPLAGVPVAVKDNMCTEGVLTTCSSKILSNFKPTYTAEAVKNLEKAGAVIIGKTNMDEFAMGSTTETSAYGVTRNPYRRIDPSAEFFLRCDRIKTDLRNRFPLRIDRLWFFLRSDRTGGKRCDRLCDNPGGDRILR